MNLEKQIILFQSEMESLEAEAKKIGALDPLIREEVEDSTLIFEEKVKGIFSDDPEYWDKRKGTGNKLAYDDPIFISQLKAIRVRQKKREEATEERIENNYINYFLKAEKAVSLIRNGVVFAQKQEQLEAMAAFKNASKEVAAIKPTALLSILCFNLGKIYFESGNIDLGVYYLSKYCGMQNEGDNYKSILEKILNLEYKNVSGHRTLKGGRLLGKKFKYTPSKVTFIQPLKFENQKIDLDYKIPYNLKLEYRDNEEIIFLDYDYLLQIDSLSTESVFFEIILPLKKFPIFINEFHKKLIEYKVKINELNDYNSLYTEIFVIDKLLNSYKHYNEKSELKKLDEMKSVAIIEVSLSKVDQVIDEYKKFLSDSVLNQKSNKILDQIAIDEVKRMYDENDRITLLQNNGYFYSEYEYHSKIAEDYARYRVFVHNLKLGISNPLKTENKKEFEEAKRYYWSLLNNSFAKYEKTMKVKEKQFTIFNLDFQDTYLERLIAIQWKKINEIIQVDPQSAILRIRIIIEGLIAAVFQKKGLNNLGEDGKALNLKKKCEKIKYALSSDIERKLCLLRRAGNSSNHFNDEKEWSYNRIEVSSKEQAEQYIKYLEEVIIYIVKRFRL